MHTHARMRDTHSRTHTHLHKRTHLSTHARKYTRVHACTHTHAHTSHPCTDRHAHTRTQEWEKATFMVEAFDAYDNKIPYGGAQVTTIVGGGTWLYKHPLTCPHMHASTHACNSV